MRTTRPPFLAGLLALLFVSGCDFTAASDAFNSLAVVVGFDPIETVVSGQILDAKTGELIEREVTLTFVGDDATSLVDFFSDPVTGLTAEGGFISFGVNNAVTPSEEAPVTFRVIAEAEGYQPGMAEVVVTDTDSIGTPFVLRLVRNTPSEAPTGTTMARSTVGAASSSGTVTDPVTAAVTDDATGARAAVTVASGTALRTGTGEALRGDLTTTLTYYGNEEEASLQALPPGFNEGASGSTDVLALAVNLSVQDQDGRLAASLGGGAGKGQQAGTSLTLQLPETFQHPYLGRSLQAGDEMKLKRYDLTTGVWTEVGTVTVADTDSGDGMLDVTVDQVAGSNLAFTFEAPLSVSCAPNATLTFNGLSGRERARPRLLGKGYRLRLWHVSDRRRGPHRVGNMRRWSDRGKDVAVVQPKLVVAYVGIDDLVIAPFDPCSGHTDITRPPDGNRTTVNFRFTPQCPAGQEARVTNIPAASVYHRKTNAPEGTPWSYGGEPRWRTNLEETYLEHGNLRLRYIELGASYDFRITYDGATYKETRTIDSRTYRIPFDATDVCS